MTVYGDLDYCELDELPPGRMPIHTRWVNEENDEPRVWTRVREEIAKGAQAFVVCARVRSQDDNDELDRSGLIYLSNDVDQGPRLFGIAEGAAPTRPARAAIDECARLRIGELIGLRVGLLHGQMPSQEKESVMMSFREGDLDVLVATTVIEVGVDVPRATVMVIEDADRFGIAQLHQLRGRVGRGGGDSYCYLLGYEISDDAEERLRAMVKTTNGFELAEIDLDLRGEGTVLGARQKGRNELRLASLRRDKELVTLARAVATEMVDADPTLSNSYAILNELKLFVGEEEAQYLERS
jgi:ATP-dependent DNA helicase RecG